MKNSFLQSWMNFDLFGIMPSLSFNGKSKSKTSVGSIFSTLLLIYMVWSIYQSFQNLVFRLNPNTITSMTLGRYNGVKFGQNHMNIGFSLIHPLTGQYSNDLSIMQPTFVKLDLPLYDNNGNILRESVVTNLEVESCTSEHFGGHFSQGGRSLPKT